jgi:trimeric autotransporter adhesin
MKRSLCVMAVALGGVMTHAQLPEIYEVLPRTARAGEVLTIFGQDFDPVAEKNVVHIGGVAARVRESWVTELEVEVPQAAQEGTITVASGGKISVSPTPFQPLFAPFGQTNAVYVRTAIFPASDYVGFTTADLNGDGGAELLCTSRDARVDVFEYVPGNVVLSTNSFQRRAQLTAGSTSNTNLMTGDFDADGRIDVLLAGRAGFELFRNTHESGTLNEASFAPRVRVNETHPEGSQFALADVNRDGRIDVITRDFAAVSFNLNTYDPTSTNRWLAARVLATPSSTPSPTHMTTGDLNQDGHLDIVVTTGDAVRIFSHSSPSEARNVFTQIAIPISGVSFVQLTDVQGDGLLDILTYNDRSGAYIVLRNRNEGGHLQVSDFEQVRLAQQETSPLEPKLLDVNGDGFPDILRGLPRSSGVYYENQSRFLENVIFPGSFLTMTNSLTNAPVVISADLNRDGAQDVIVLEGRVGIYQNIGAQRAVVSGIQATASLYSMRIVGNPNEWVVLQTSIDLNGWTNVSTLRLGSSGVWNYTSTAGDQMRFFRVQPTP